MTADGSNLSYIPTDPNVTGPRSFFPTWSADGSKLAFVSSDTPNAPDDIITMDLDGSNQVNLTKTPKKGESDADFSSDGSQICFSLEGGIYLMNADGSDRTLLIGEADGMITGCDWSPDGKKIAFESDRDGGDYDIYTMNADGSDVAPVTTNSRWHDMDPDWQPLPGTTSPKDADGSNEAQGTKKPGVDDVDRDLPERTVIVKPGDSLWSISEQRLGPEASPQRVYEHTYQMYALNRKRIGSDPDLIFVGQRLSLPPLGEG
jgi:Tol biopolymer transport system component